jgi:hypothetical protein
MKTMRTTAVTLLLGVTVAMPAHAFLVPGGPTKGKALQADCYAEVDVNGITETNVTTNTKGVPTITCTDGDPCDAGEAGDDQCIINLGVCINQTNVPECTPPGSLSKLTAKGKAKGTGKIVIGVPELLEGSVCGAYVDVPVPVKVKKNGTKSPGKGKVKVVGKAPKGTQPNKDTDNVTIFCAPGEGGGGGDVCPDNAAGGPDKLKMTIAQTGNDLDNGWTGISQNFAVTPNGSLNVCLSECDTSSDTECTANGPVGDQTINGPVFGAPLPLLASNVPVCVVNRFNEDITGTANFATGDINLRVTLLSDVFFTDSSEVCPRCSANNRCSSGARQGQPCTTDATLVVAEGLGNKTYNLSEDCPPLGNPVATLNIVFDPLTSGQADALVGPTPCTRPKGTPPGVNPQPNDCAGQGCGAQCTGNACATMVPDPTNPSQMVCVDNKGGISQLCCNGNTTTPCFPLENGGTLTRNGRAEAPAPAFPDTTFPKSGTGVLAATFCEAATGTNTIDTTTGLPGPAALLLSGTQDWTEEPAAE